MKPPTISQRPDLTPYRLQFSAGYAAIRAKGIGTFGGAVFKASAGQDFFLGRRTSFFLQGAVGFGALEGKPDRHLSFLHLGLESGFDFRVAPRFLNAFVFTGVGTKVFHSPLLAGSPQISMDNAMSLAMTLGAGASLFHGLLVLTGAWEPNFGIKVHREAETAKLNLPMAFWVGAGLDLARATALRPEEDFDRPASFAKWIRGFRPGLVVDGTYSYNFRRPTGGKNDLRGFDKRWDRPMGNYLELSLERPTGPTSPFGLRADFGVGEDAAFAAPVDAFSGKYYTLQQLYAALRLPIGRGLTFRGPIFATPIGAEVLEGPLNNQISRSFQFNYGIPFRHLGLLADCPFSEKVAVSAGLVHGWDNDYQLGNEVSPAFLGTLNVSWTESFKTSVAGTVGEDLGRIRSIVDFIASVGLKKFALTGNYDWGHDNPGKGLPADNWHAFSLMARYDFNKHLGLSVRGEVFADLNGVRTGAKQVLGEFTSTFHLQPWKWLRFRVEYRHDQSDHSVFHARQAPAKKQDTLALGLGLVF